MPASPFINEFHYDNTGTDIGEFVEIAAAAGTDLTGWKIILYNGNPAQRTAYNTLTLSGVVADQQNGFGAISFAYNNVIQNGGAGAGGEPDGIALVDPTGAVVQFLSYEGSFTAASGPAAGLTSNNVGAGVYEDGTRGGTSVGLVGTGTTLADYQYALITSPTAGGVNTGQSFAAVAPPAAAGTLGIADAAVAEGDGGVSDIVFTVTRTNGSAGAVSATYTVSFGSADRADFGASFTATGTVAFAAGATTAEVRLPVQGDTAFEGAETFAVTLSAPQGGATLGAATATGTITNDDAAPAAGPGNVFINEIHYDNSGVDAGEAIEIAGAAGTDLSGYRLVFYNGTNTPAAAPVYDTLALTGTIDDEGDGFGAVSFARAGIQNGGADGVALIAPDGAVIELLSYEGVFTAAPGTPAAGMTSTDISVAEEPAPGVGLSLQLTGAGSGADDFTWKAAATQSFGQVNAGQSFLSATGPGYLRVGDTRVVEGDDGATNLVFTVYRAGGTAQAATVDYAINLDGTAGASDLAAGAVLAGTLRFAAGDTRLSITVPIEGDRVGEDNETLSVTLGATTGNVVVTDARGVGTIVNDDPLALSIRQIQGEGHRSAYEGQSVITNGVVIAVDSNGFYLQSAVGDGNARTSDGVFVFTGTAPGVAVGDEATVRGTITEFRGDPKALTLTEITAPTVTVVSHGNALPAAILIGAGGLMPPTEVIDDDGLSSFDPEHDGIDFWESLEGMRVTLDSPQAVSNTTSRGETDVVVSHGAGATGVNDRGGITISPGDYNPEKIQIDDDSGIFAGFTPGYTIGDQLSNVTGVVNYAFNNYEVLVTEAVAVTKDVTLDKEVSGLRGDANYLSLATYNLENLDPTDMKFDVLAGNIVYNLRAPDILAVQEVQDADGAGTGANLSGTVTAQGLIDAIHAQSGLRYGYVEVAPVTANSTGGEPNGNIRNGFFYNLDRVSYVANSAELITDGAYNGSRNPLAAQFSFAGQVITAIDVHFTSRGGSDPLWGEAQPPSNAGDAARTAQAAGVKAYIDAHLADDPALNFAVLGDFNGFYFEDAQTQLTDSAKGGVLTNLSTLLPPEERYSYLFEGNAQQIDHILVTGGLVTNAEYDAVHLNSQFSGERPTDHDPQLALLFLGAAPTDLTLSNAAVAENLPAGALVGTLAAADTANDTLTYALLDDAGGRFTVDARTGVVTTAVVLDHEAAASYRIVGKATDTGGLSTQAGFTVSVTDVNETPVARGDAIRVDEDATSANLWATLLGDDSDPDLGDTLAIRSVDATGTLGSLLFDPATRSLRYLADNDAFDALAPGETVVDHFRYTVTDAGGLTSVATVDVAVTGVADGVRINGGNGAATLTGTGGEDTITGGNGSDTLNGLSGHDFLFGGNGDDRLFGGDGRDVLRGDNGDDLLDGGAGTDTLNGGNGDDRLSGGDGRDVLHGENGNDLLDGGAGADTLVGGKGGDILTGGAGADVFRFAGADGTDRITDFDTAEDSLALDGVRVAKWSRGDVNRDGATDLTIQFTGGASAVLLGVGQFDAVRFTTVDNRTSHASTAADRLGDGLWAHLAPLHDPGFSVLA